MKRIRDGLLKGVKYTALDWHTNVPDWNTNVSDWDADATKYFEIHVKA